LISIYLLPLVLVGFALMIAFWRTCGRERQNLSSQLQQARTLVQHLEVERDTAMQELFRRFREEGKLNRERSQFQAQLAEYEKYAALTQLALGAAHEINNPLLGILSHLELELSVAPSEGRIEIEQCIEGAQRIAMTLRSLMNYARPGPLVLSKINLYRLVSDTVAFLEHQPILHGKLLENQVPPDLPSLRVDANQLSQILMNLLLNAAEATPEGGRVTVSASAALSGEGVIIRVIDTGSGIPPEILAHVFEPFFTTKRGKGTGLGLSISQAYVRSHNGEIEIQSTPQHGTTVTITLPLQPIESVAGEMVGLDSKEVIIH
jgi:signal transduction histidine kinase